jgi:pimeloyl-ACP methyl ester carboxylesterase
MTVLATLLMTTSRVVAANRPAENSSPAGVAMKSGYADADGLRVYYEVQGTGEPLVLLHGSFMTIDATWATLRPTLSKSRQVIAIELQGHGHTADRDRPMSYERMADDVAAVLRHLGIERADVLGYSMGGTVATGVALRHPPLVKKLIVVSAVFDNRGWEPQVFEQFKALPKDFAPKPLTDAYEKVAPDPKRWPVLVAKVKTMVTGFEGWKREDLQAMKAPLLIVMGDRDGFRAEHALEIERLVPNGQLAFIPGGDHFFLWSRADLLLPMITSFLDAP